ncbi:MAG: cytochrome-c oxidase, cbb3-type subunit III, partial [Pseudomonadota bacterium]
IAYLAVYPGMGNFAGFFGWSSANQYDKEMARAEKKYGPIYAQYREVAVPELAKNAEATAMGRRLYLTSCIQCHGSDAQGSKGYPNLADSAWLWGGSPEQIKQSIASGRQGVMPPHQAMLNDQGVDEVAHYVLSLSGRSDADAAKAEAGKARYAVCQGCHMPGGEGNPMLGAPDLTDKDWLYGRHVDDVKKVIAEGKQGVMPAHDETLSSDKIHLLTAYVYSLSNG